MSRSSLSIQPVKCCLTSSKTIVINIAFDYGLLRLPDLDYWFTAGVTGQQGMLTPPWHVFPHIVYPDVRVCRALIFVFFFYIAFLLLPSNVNKQHVWSSFQVLPKTNCTEI